MLMTILFCLLLGTTLCVMVWSGARLFESQDDPLADRLEELQAHAKVSAQRQPRRKGGGFLNGFLYLVSLAPGGDEWLRESERELSQAGIRRRLALAVYALGHVLFFLGCLAVMVWLQRDNPWPSKFGGVTAALLIGWLIPMQALHWLVRRYRQKLRDALPDTIDLLGIVLGTGLSMDQAILRVSEEMQYIYPELASEFYTVVMQVKAGQERAKAFQQLVRRTGVEDIKSLSTMIVQSERFGTSLSQALKVYAEALRTRRRLKAETAVAKAGIKMLFPIVLFILPVLFVITLVPGLLSVLESLRGGIGAR